MFAQAKGGLGPRIPARRLIGLLVSGVVAGGLIICGFYLIGD
jgi:hypothetical protein